MSKIISEAFINLFMMFSLTLNGYKYFYGEGISDLDIFVSGSIFSFLIVSLIFFVKGK